MAWWRRRAAEDFDDEIRAHVEAEMARLRDRGVAPDEARRRARVAFGGVTLAREGFRERSRWRWFDTLWQDVRYGARLMRRSRAFTITAVVVLGLGIGVNTALFSVINSLFFRDLHVKQPDRLVYLQTKIQTGRVDAYVSQEHGAFLRDAARELADFTAHQNTIANVSIDGQTSRLDGEVVEANYFDLLGVTIERGRAFRTEDNELSNPELSVIVSHDFWTKRLAGDADAIGKPVRINSRTFRIIGIAPVGFHGLASPFWPSMWWVPSKTVAEGAWGLGPIARLKPGVDLAALRALVEAKTPGLLRQDWERIRARAWPWEVYQKRGFALAKIADVDVPSQPQARLVPPAILAAVTTVSGLVLVIACANIAGLLLARGRSRTGEVAVRQALGAAGLRLFRQMVTESLLLSGMGALVGVAVAIALVRLFAAVTPETLSVPVSIDPRVLAFAVCGALATGLLVGLMPALQATRVQVLQALGSGVIGSRGTGRSLARWIVVPQVTVSLVLLIVAAAHVRALRQVEGRNLGYRTTGTTAFEIVRGQVGLDQWTKRTIVMDPSYEARARTFERNVLNATSAAPGVDQFAVVSPLPLSNFSGAEKPVLGRDASQPIQPSPISAVEVFVSDGYFDVMDMHTIAGRTFDERDRPYESAGPRAAVVSASIARVFGGADLVGRSISLPADDGGKPRALEVVGIVNDVDQVLNDGRIHPVVYEALNQQARPGVGNLLVRGHGDPAELMASVRKAILGADPSAEITRVRPLDDMVGEILYPRRLAAGLLAAAATIALALACIGLYGIVSYTAAERTREFGIRATLGATRQDIVRLVLRDGAIVLGAGISLGLVLGAVALRTASSVVRGLPTFDAVVFVTVPLAFVLVVLVACLSPALRASRIDPAQVIRGE